MEKKTLIIDDREFTYFTHEKAQKTYADLRECEFTYTELCKIAFKAVRNHYDRHGWVFLAKSEDADRIINGIYEFCPIYWEGKMPFDEEVFLSLFIGCRKSYVREFKYEYAKMRNEVYDLEGVKEKELSVAGEFSKTEFFDLIARIGGNSAKILIGIYEGYTMREIAQNLDIPYTTALRKRDLAFETFKAEWLDTMVDYSL